ncbi:DUF4232 domain-containing protein [Streptomyces sp. NPDC047130]|uniref:DUF4232 domain-containing protein n=1 Tax=Streptomyces sp. NPDC047130 TaxID=3155261 RepID=UPI0033EC148A
MGSLRNPVGPLPSSIYWRRRAVFFVVLLALAGLIGWLVAGGGGGSQDPSDGSDGKNPAPSITPGPSGSGPAIDNPPGGGSGTGGGSGGTPSGDASDGSGGSDGDAEAGEGGDGDAAGGPGGGSGSGSGSSSGSGGAGANWTSSVNRLPGGSTLATCDRGDVRLTLRSVRNTYEDGEKPVLRLTVTNTSGGDCKVDLGPRATVLKITKANAEDDETYWSSADCPKDGALLFRVPKGGSVTYDLEWDRRPSDADRCEAAPKGRAGAGTYLVVAKTPATSSPLQATFTLKSD